MPETYFKKEITTRNIFLLFLKIGTFAFGGVYSMLAFFEKELVEKRRWLTHDDFTESVAIGQMTPGPPIINTGICVGYKLKKLKGAIATVFGQIFTGTILAIIFAIFYIKSGENPILRSAMKGVGAAVVGLLLSITYKMASEIIRDYKPFIFALSAFMALAIMKLNPVWLIIAAGVIGFFVFKRSSK